MQRRNEYFRAVLAAASVLAVLGLAGCLGLAGDLMPDDGLPTSDATLRAYSQTFTATEDFRKGVLNGVSDDTAGQLQMSIGQTAFATPYMWIPNSTENSITLIDTIKSEVVGTYPLADPVTGEPCYNPSRTTVDFNWDVWVGCRGFSSYINGRQGKTIQEVDDKVMKVSFKTGKVLLSLKVGNAPRALAIDANNHVWIGASVDDTVWEVDGDTGQCYRGNGCQSPAIAVPDFPYGAVVDQDGMLWIVNNKVPTAQPDQLTKIDTRTGQVVAIYGPYLRNGCNGLYGIAIDQLGDAWVGGFECDDVVKVNGKTGELIGAYLVGGKFSRGVAVDLDGNVWVASSGTNTITKVNGATGALISTVGVGSQPIGVAVDAYGHVWAVNRGADSVTKVNGIKSTTAVTGVGNGPYSYSDMLGLALRTITLRKQLVATWRSVVDAGHERARFTTIGWAADVPPNTTFSVRVRCAQDRLALETVPFGPEMLAPGAVSCGGQSRFLELEARFTSVGTSASPALKDLTVHWEG
ncbi:MAG: hypothetical protein HYZ28_06305 [Myxococcales bacterium]|nr:hypothetical protein [Myxococcales bacterium]